MVQCRLKVILWEKKLKNREFADMIGVSETTVSAWVTDKQLPKLDQAYRVAKVLGLDVTEIWVYEVKGEKEE